MLAEHWTVDAEIALEISSHEAIIREAYLDSENVWTWSVGLTSATGHDVTRYIGKPQPLQHCLAVYAWALNNYADAVRKAFKGHHLTKEQFAAALSFHWNTGQIGGASWVDKWKAGDIAGAKKAFMDWRKPKAIIPRREKERDLFFAGKWHNVGTMTEYTRLTAKSTPDWKSAKRIAVAKELRACFEMEKPAQPAPIPPRKPAQPTVALPGPVEAGWLSKLLAALKSLFAKG